MTTQNTLATLNSEFKYVQDKAQSLMPENAVLMDTVPELTEATKQGQSYNIPIQTSFENGITYGDGTVFQLNNPAAASYGNIQVISYPMILLTQISEAVANNMANDRQTFITEASLRATVMQDSIARFYEISMLYGQSGIGVTTTASSGSGTTANVILTAASWSDGIWAGALGMVVNFYSGSTQVNGSTGQFTVSAIAPGSTSFTVTGASGDITALNTAITAGALSVYIQGAYTNEMYGLDYQITAASNSLTCFGVSGVTNPLWAGNVFPCGSTSLTMAKVLQGVSLAVGIGGLNSEALLMVNAGTYNNLNNDLSALRGFDKSYDPKSGENGFDDIVYQGPGMKIRVKVNNIVKRGEAHLLPVKHLKRVGAKEISFNRPGHKDTFFQEIPGYAGYSLRVGGDFCVLLERPAQAVKFTGIVNSVA